MYKIMTVKSRRNDNKNLYQWYLDKNSNDAAIYETTSSIELSSEVEELLKTTPVDDILIVSTVNFTVDALIETEIGLRNSLIDSDLHFRIFIVKEHRDDLQTLYKWHLMSDDNSNNAIYETSDLTALAEEVEKVLKTEPINDILIVNNIDFSIEAMIDGDILSTLETIEVGDIDEMFSNVKNDLYDKE